MPPYPVGTGFLLRGTSLSVTVIAERVGYTSEAAFSRAFKNRYSARRLAGDETTSSLMTRDIVGSEARLG